MENYVLRAPLNITKIEKSKWGFGGTVTTCIISLMYNDTLLFNVSDGKMATSIRTKSNTDDV